MSPLYLKRFFWKVVETSTFAARCCIFSRSLWWECYSLHSHLLRKQQQSQWLKKSNKLIKKTGDCSIACGTDFGKKNAAKYAQHNGQHFSHRLLQVHCNKEQCKRLFLPTAIVFFAITNLVITVLFLRIHFIKIINNIQQYIYPFRIIKVFNSIHFLKS